MLCMLQFTLYNGGMKDKKNIECWECGKSTPNRVAHVIRIGHLLFCRPCWAVHPWNPKEIQVCP